MNKSIWITLCFTLLLAGCSGTVEKLRRVGKPPEFSGLEISNPQNNQTSQVDTVDKERIRSTNSLWQPGSTTFFRDNRAWRVGDILRVTVQIRDSAKLDNSTQQKRDSASSSGISKLFGKEKKIAKALNVSDLNPLASVSGKGDHKGSGNISRQESVKIEIAATVKQVLQNGNLVIGGHQEVRVNHELREIKIAGIIRPKDISADNAIHSDQIAEARISYGGRGTVSDVQEPKVGSQILDIITPF